MKTLEHIVREFVELWEYRDFSTVTIEFVKSNCPKYEALKKYVDDTDIENKEAFIPPEKYNYNPKAGYKEHQAAIKEIIELVKEVEKKRLEYLNEHLEACESKKKVEEPKEERPTLLQYIDKREEENINNPFATARYVSDYIEQHIAPRLNNSSNNDTII